MSTNNANVNVWEGTDVLVAPVGTTAPTDIATAFSATWKALGGVSEDGLTESREDNADPKYDSYGQVVRTVLGNHERSFQVTVLEDNPVVNDLLNPAGTAATTGGVTTRVVKAPKYDPRAFAFVNVDGTTTSRVIIPKGQVTAVGDVQRLRSDLATRELTISVYPASDGTLYREITNAPGAVVP